MQKLLLLSILIPLLAMISCGDEPTPDPKPKQAPRTVLVYMVANNSLSGFDSYDLEEMEVAAKAGDLGSSRLIVYHHARNAMPQLKEVTAEGIVVLKDYDKDDYSTSSRRMLQVISDMKSLAPADNYGIVLWSHGSGWLQDGIDESGGLNPLSESGEVKPLSFGQDGSKWMNVTTLASTLEGAGFDYVYFDCCYMSGIEVMYQMRRVAPLIVASATELPAKGMPYNLNLRHLMPAKADLVAAASTTFDAYDALSGEARTCTMSVINTAALDKLAGLTARIYSAKIPPADDFEPQPFMLKNCYLFDFEQYVEAKCSDKELLAEWKKALAETVVYENNTPRLWNVLDIEHHCGLSTNILSEPGDADFKNYRQLDWWTDVASSLF